MKVERNVEGLRQNAQKKRQQTLEKVETGIQQLIKEKRVINFNTVAEASGVSKAWLYKEPEVRGRIEHLRAQGANTKKTPQNHRVSDTSKDALIRTLRERIKRLEAKNLELSRQNEVFGGQILRIRDLEKEVQRLKVDNERLQQQLSQKSNTANQPGLQDFERTLASLGIELNSTIKRLISETPGGIIETAIESLKEAISRGQVRNPSGFLNKAVTDAWKPNETHQEKINVKEFNEWWKYAYGKGLVKAATQVEGVQHVLMADDKWMPFHAAVEEYPCT